MDTTYTQVSRSKPNTHVFDDSFLGEFSSLYAASETEVVQFLLAQIDVTADQKSNIKQRTIQLVESSREDAGDGALFDQFLQEFGLSSTEGVTLMRLAESLIRTPDFDNKTSLLRDKLIAGDWKSHAGNSSSWLVNSATSGLRLSSAWIKASGGVNANNLVSKLGDRVLLRAVQYAMNMMSDHFVLGKTIGLALKKSAMYEKKGFSFSYDMLGEAAHTQADADHYFKNYLNAANTIAKTAKKYPSYKEAPGLSVKLSALHPRYESVQRQECVPKLVESVGEIALIAKQAGFGLTIDAEETERLEVSLEVVHGLLNNPALHGWDGLAVVVQAYQKRSQKTIEWLVNTARAANRCISIRLVKGAYWDMEVKRAQELGLADYPVFTRKENTDLSYLACAQQLFKANDCIYPQFATHNAQTAAAIIELAGKSRNYEFQRLYGMGPELHAILMKEAGVKSRIYAPVGKYKDLLPYLVRRLLENGANSSFVYKVLDPKTPASSLAVSPESLVTKNIPEMNPKIPLPLDHLGYDRLAAKGWDFTQYQTASQLMATTKRYVPEDVYSIIAGKKVEGTLKPVISPTHASKPISNAHFADKETLQQAFAACHQSTWSTQFTPEQRSQCLLKAAKLLEQRADAFFSLCVQEAGKTLPDAIAEVREAVDFCRYYAGEALTPNMHLRSPLGNVLCISPWNFPLAIFLGQITAALSVGNNVIAKPAETTPIIASEAIDLLYDAGIPHDSLHLIIGEGSTIGSALVASEEIHGICFTGSTQTAKRISQTLAVTNRPLTPLIAETGGLNAMIIDSTALLEQCVADVVASSFQSAGQRCSACRIVCVQDSIADDFIKMLAGAMALLNVGEPAYLSTDVGPVIDQNAKNKLTSYSNEGKKRWKVIAQTPVPEDLDGYFVPPIAFEINALSELEEEQFGPILHVVRFASDKLSATVNQINALGYGLTMGLHTRIDARVDEVRNTAKVGNLYINRNQIGAVVGVQPFGGEGLSGTGPKAGGPHYLYRLSKHNQFNDYTNSETFTHELPEDGADIDKLALTNAQIALSNWSISEAEAFMTQFTEDQHTYLDVESMSHLPLVRLPGPTGETNELSLHPRGVLVCSSDHVEITELQILKALGSGNAVIVCVDDLQKTQLAALLDSMTYSGLPEHLMTLASINSLPNYLKQDIQGAVIDGKNQNSVASYFCKKAGPILPCLSAHDDVYRFVVERTTTINTTAAGGNASLLAM
ncbi:bifunctional proline dehydrogenase/L-glutamate gamma-semialdehyde dehydrogenase PutA [Hirschia baltica]|uniref:Bifunctional protein PutA n=1 Tax=Hirschia baltica (strain ATCC 49814 / DSM 5838 / IFAM 1418) TaxID=582402 RepID=C6XJL8_HIRBI|nr:bifunctional proline dehydrogenase/L-glutamate gamma-semialdehyde dehydrogenase PutA [Hirschia baltica]ACT59313.1 delta-1-pyrroline-5-carboxylate dehydrogenase [Hirschia baltica ATCC 49814]